MQGTGVDKAGLEEEEEEEGSDVCPGLSSSGRRCTAKACFLPYKVKGFGGSFISSLQRSLVLRGGVHSWLSSH